MLGKNRKLGITCYQKYFPSESKDFTIFNYATYEDKITNINKILKDFNVKTSLLCESRYAR